MKVIQIIALIVAIGLAAGPRVMPYFQPGPTVPQVTYGLDVSIPPTLAGSPEAAQKLAGICDGIADVIESDGLRQQPKLLYVSNINDSLKTTVDLAFNGEKISKLYPQFVSVVSPVLKNELGDGTQPLDASTRQKAVNVFRAIAYGCRRSE